MIQPLPEFPPLFPPGSWWRFFVAEWCSSPAFEASESLMAKSVAAANRKSGIKSRAWMRVLLRDDTLFSIPVSGGASALKNHPPFSWTMAGECGRELRKFQATFATLYSRCPFFSTLGSDLFPAVAPSMAASEVCLQAFHRVVGILGLDNPSMRQSILDSLHSGPNRRLEAVAGDFERCFHSSLSILDALMRLGPDAIFPLLQPFMIIPL